MARLNKNPLPPEQLTKLLDQFDNTLGRIPVAETGPFFSELLGHEERIMLAKRLAIIILLLEEYSLYKISNLLKVSSGTAENIKRRLNKGEYDHIVRVLGKDKNNYFQILEAIDTVLHLGGMLPHYNGIERYKFLK